MLIIWSTRLYETGLAFKKSLGDSRQVPYVPAGCAEEGGIFFWKGSPSLMGFCPSGVSWGRGCGLMKGLHYVSSYAAAILKKGPSVSNKYVTVPTHLPSTYLIFCYMHLHCTIHLHMYCFRYSIVCLFHRKLIR